MEDAPAVYSMIITMKFIADGFDSRRGVQGHAPRLTAAVMEKEERPAGWP